MGALRLVSAARSEAGPVRAHNEDAVLAGPRLIAVADGVGGAAAGEVASRVTIGALERLDKTVLHGPLDAALAEAVDEGNATIAFVAACRPALAGMASTLTAVGLDDGGHISDADAAVHPMRHVVSAVLDGGTDRHATVGHHDARAGDRVLVCSDGVSDVLDDAALAVVLRDGSPVDAADRLVADALAAGSRDNVSVVVADVVPGDGWA